MGALADYAEGQIVGHLFRTGTFTKPTGLWIGLLTVAPTDSTAGTEVTGGSYARVARAPLDANWAAPVSGNGTTSNVAAVAFPTPTADWGTAVAVAVYDAVTGGNMIAWGVLAASRTIRNGDGAPTFNPGAFVFAID